MIAPDLAPELVAVRLVADLDDWRSAHPGWTPDTQRAAFPAEGLWIRVDRWRPVGDFDWGLYRQLCEMVDVEPGCVA